MSAEQKPLTKNKRPKEKTETIRFRCSPAYRQEVGAKAEAAGLPMSDLIRASLDRVRVWTAEDRQAKAELARQVAKVGNNLNQIARHANKFEAVHSIGILNELRLIREALERISDAS